MLNRLGVEPVHTVPLTLRLANLHQPRQFGNRPLFTGTLPCLLSFILEVEPCCIRVDTDRTSDIYWRDNLGSRGTTVLDLSRHLRQRITPLLGTSLGNVITFSFARARTRCSKRNKRLITLFKFFVLIAKHTYSLCRFASSRDSPVFNRGSADVNMIECCEHTTSHQLMELTTETPDKFIEMMQINLDAFEAGNYNTAYQALTVVLFCARDERNSHYCSLVEQTAQQQGQWIDTYAPDYMYSGTYLKANGIHRGGIFVQLALEAGRNTHKTTP